MDFGGGLATGIAIGIGTGMASGMSSGQSQSKQQLHNYIEQNGITIQDRFGKPVKPDDFLDEVYRSSCNACPKARWVGFVIAGLAVLAAVAVAIYFIR